MTAGHARRFFLPSFGVALAAGVSSLTGAVAAGIPAFGWCVAGWFAATIPGVGGGVWLAGMFGRPDSGFLVALGASMGLRMVAVGAGLIAALRAGGPGASTAFLLGFGATFVPLAVFEAVWFRRASRRPGS